MAIAVATVAAGVLVPPTGVTISSAASFTTCEGGAAASGSVLQAGQQLANGQCLLSSNGQFQLLLTANDSLELLNSAGALLWSAPNAPAQGGELSMQGDGNLVLYNTAIQPLWSSATTGLGGTTAVLQDDGNFVIYTPAGTPVWSTNTSQTSPSEGCVGTPNTSTATSSSSRNGPVPGSNILAPAGQSATLQPGQALCAGGYVALMQSDGNLVLYISGEPIWATYTAGHSGAVATLQNGNVTVGSWSAQPNGGYCPDPSDTSQFLLTNTGDLSVLCFLPSTSSDTLNAGQTTEWSSGTGGGGYTQLLSPNCPPDILQCTSTLTSPDRAYQLVMQPDGNLVDYFVTNGSPFAVWASGTATPGAVAVMQDDGNLVIYPPGTPESPTGPNALFATGTTTTSPVLSLDNNGNLTIWGTNAGGNYSVWSSHSVAILGDGMTAGQALQPGQGLLSQGGQYRLSMGTNGAAELTETNVVGTVPDSCPIWTAPHVVPSGFQPATQANAYLDLTTSGDLELLPQGQQPGTGTPIWSTNTQGGTKLIVQSDGNVVLYNSAGNALWSSNSWYVDATGIWCTGMKLGSTDVGSPTQGQVAGGDILLAMQTDCNLVAYTNAPAVYSAGATWSSGTDKGDNPPAGTNPSSPYYGCYAIMQSDGNVVIYTGSGQALWASGTNQSSTPPGSPPIPGPYVAVVGYTGGGCPANSSDSNDPNKCINYSGYTLDPNSSNYDNQLVQDNYLPSLAFSVTTYDGLVLGSPNVLNTPTESAGTALGQAFTLFGYLGNVFGSFGFPSVLSLGQAAWGTFSLGALPFAKTNCPGGASCSQEQNSGQPSSPAVENLSTCGPSSPSAMPVGSNLNPGGCLESANKEYVLIMQSDGNLVVYYQQASTVYPIWASNTSGNPGAHAYLQQNGPLYVYSTSGAPLYNTPGTAGAVQATLVMQTDGNLVLYANNVQAGGGTYAVPYAAWSTQTSSNRGNILASGEVLNPGQSLVTSSDGANGPGAYSLTMQTNGVLVQSQPNLLNGTTESSGCPLWTQPPIENIGSSGTSYAGGAGAGSYLFMQSDGNLVLYGPGQNAKVAWQSGTAGNPGAYAVLGSNGQFSIYSSSGQFIWSNYTNVYRGGVLCSGATLQGSVQQALTGYPAGTGSPQLNASFPQDKLLMQGDCNLVVYIQNQANGGSIAAWGSDTSVGSNEANNPSSPYYGCYATQQTQGNLVIYAPNYYGPNQPKALWSSGFTASSPGSGGPNSTGPYAAEFAPLNGTGNYGLATYDTVTGVQEWFSSYSTKVNDISYSDKGASSLLEKLGSWIHTFLGIIVFIAAA